MTFDRLSTPPSFVSPEQGNHPAHTMTASSATDHSAGPARSASKASEVLHRRERVFACEHCDKTFATKAARGNHRDTHAIRFCDWEGCEEGPFAFSALLVHRATHTGNLFKCTWPDCAEAFPRSETRDFHVRTHQAGGNSHNMPQQLGEQKVPSFPRCTVKGCDRIILDTGNYQRHVAEHSERPYACTVCDGRFKRQQHLDKHMRTIHTVKPMKCAWLDCGETFPRSETRDLHVGTRKPTDSSLNKPKQASGGPPYKCSEKGCGMSYDLLRSYSRHLKSHSGEPLYKCISCNRGFNRSDSLKAHEKTHSEDRPFECTVCDGRFKRKGHLDRHTERFHTEEPTEA